MSSLGSWNNPFYIFIFLILLLPHNKEIQNRTHVSLNSVIWLDGRQSFCIARKSK